MEHNQAILNTFSFKGLGEAPQKFFFGQTVKDLNSFLKGCSVFPYKIFIIIICSWNGGSLPPHHSSGSFAS